MAGEVEEIKSRLSVADVVGEYVRLTKAGVSFKGLCPFHNERTPSFVVSEERQAWHCFGCSKGGDIFTFLMEMEGMDFREALKTLAEKAGVELRPTTGNRQAITNNTQRIIEALEWAVKFYEKQLWDGEGRTAALAYLYDRGLTDETIRHFRLGYAPALWNSTEKFLAKRGYTPQEITSSGLVIQKSSQDDPLTPHISHPTSHSYDRFRNRIMFPITDVLGRVVGFSARVLPGDDEKNAKYINTPETAVYHKSRILYGISYAKQAIKKAGEALVVEGNMDVIALHQAGFQNACAVSGTALTPEHLTILKRYAPKVKLFFDMDNAGQEAMKKSVLLALSEEVGVSVVSLSEGKDAAELVQSDPGALAAAIQNAEDAAAHIWNEIKKSVDIRSPQGKRAAAEAMAFFIAAMRNEVERSYWMRTVAREIGVDEEALRSLISRRQERSYVSKWRREEDEPEKAKEYNRLAALSMQMLGVLLAFPDIWKEFRTAVSDLGAEEKEVLFAYEPLSFAVGEGERLSYSGEDFFSLLSEGDSADVRRSFHRARFDTEEEDGIVERSAADARAIYKKCFSDMREEVKRARLAKTEEAMRAAEASGSRDHVEALIKKHSEISMGGKSP